MLYFGCQRDPVRLTEHLRGTRESEQKKKITSAYTRKHRPHTHSSLKATPLFHPFP